jgi:probable HAF family extracellular repeat protein
MKRPRLLPLPILLLLIPIALNGCGLFSSDEEELVNRLVDVGIITGGTSTYAAGINDAGVVVGYSNLSAGYEQPFRWEEGVFTPLPLLVEGKSAEAIAINDAGVIVGGAYDAMDRLHAVIWQGGVVDTLGTINDMGESYAAALNEAGDVVGWSYLTATGFMHACLWHDGEAIDLGTFGGSSSQATGINESGQVTGYAETSGQVIHAFLWADDVMTDLGTGEGVWSNADAIDDAGKVVGIYRTADGDNHPCSWTGGVLTDLAASAEWTSCKALAIGGDGTIGGFIGTTPGGNQAAVWIDGEQIRLVDLLQEGSGWSLRQVVGVNTGRDLLVYGTVGGIAHGAVIRAFDPTLELRPE